MLEVSCRLVVAEFGLKTVRLVTAFSFRICIAVKFRIVETSSKWNSKAQTCSKAVLVCRRVAEECLFAQIGAKSFIDGRQDICKDTDSNLGRFAGF